VRHLPRVNPREYYTLPPGDKALLLTYLCDELLQTSTVRNELDTREGLVGDDGDDDDGGGGGVGAVALHVSLRVGTSVEVFGVEEGLHGSWYSAVVVAATVGRCSLKPF